MSAPEPTAAAQDAVGTAAQDAVGTAAQETARLLQSLGGWFAPPTSAAAGADEAAAASPADGDAAAGASTDSAAGHDGQDGHDGSACRACPVCRGVEAVRAVRPELVEHLALAAESLAAALRELGRPPARPDVHPPGQASRHEHDEQDGAAPWG